jgi:MtaA/CmuA family methyltransferase
MDQGLSRLREGLIEMDRIVNGSERFFTALNGGVPDRVPIFLRDLTLGLDLLGYSTPEVCGGSYDAGKSAKAVISSQSRYHQDAVVGCIHSVGLEAQALGGEVRFPERGIPAIMRHPFEKIEDIGRLTIPDISRDPAYQGVLESYDIVSKALQDKAAVVCNLEGPMTKAALLRGLESFALDLQQDPDMARDLVRISLSLSEQYIEETNRRGADVLFIAAATDNPDIFGDTAFLDHTIPGVHQLVQKAKCMGMSSIFHPHGVFSRQDMSLVKKSIGTGVQGIQFAENNDFAPLKRICQDKVCILGGIDAFSTLLLGPEERIDKETESFMQCCSPGGGYIFMCSCSLHRGMPLGNVDTMVRSCLKHGSYKIRS